VLPHAAPQHEELLFFPYWRFKGMLFFCLEEGVRHRFLDLSHPAVDAAVFPGSLGLRSQALKLRFVTPGLEGRFIAPGLKMNEALQRLEARFSSGFSGKAYCRSHVGESLSLIYAPFYVQRRLYDAVLNLPVSGLLDDRPDPRDLPSGPAGDHIRFIATICPHCGADLEGERDSLALVCKNCDSLWTGRNGGLRRLPFGVLKAEHRPDRYLPFWRIEADVGGMALRSLADLVRAANLPRRVDPAMEAESFCFWAMGFKLRPQAFLRLATLATLAQPRGNPIAGFPGGRLHPVTLSLSEAVQSVRVILANFIKPRRLMITRLPQVTITPKRLKLVYLPFEESRHDLVHPGLGLAVNKAMLETAGNL
jgi:hypothetical protein